MNFIQLKIPIKTLYLDKLRFNISTFLICILEVLKFIIDAVVIEKNINSNQLSSILFLY